MYASPVANSVCALSPETRDFHQLGYSGVVDVPRDLPVWLAISAVEACAEIRVVGIFVVRFLPTFLTVAVWLTPHRVEASPTSVISFMFGFHYALLNRIYPHLGTVHAYFMAFLAIDHIGVEAGKAFMSTLMSFFQHTPYWYLIFRSAVLAKIRTIFIGA